MVDVAVPQSKEAAMNQDACGIGQSARQSL
jgi:hypothetical protein